MAPLPGGDFPSGGDAALSAALTRAFPFVPATTARRLVRSYGTRAFGILDGATSAGDLGVDFGAGLTEREVRYLCAEEWASTAEDVLWRRSKLGLKIDEAGAKRLRHWFETTGAARAIG